MGKKIWHTFVWKILRLIVSPFIRLKFNYTPQICYEKGPVIVLCNHNTDWDPLFLGIAFPGYLSLVASEHIFRWGTISSIIKFLFDPIPRLKGTTAVSTALNISRKLRKGISVAIFAEGNRSFNGVTGFILPSTSKLVKTSKATLVTYKIHGGYLASPRWSGSKIRKGKINGEIVGVYSAEKIKEMSVDEIDRLIQRDLYEDAYELQRKKMVPFVSENPAEHLETLLCYCPKCKNFNTLYSKKDKLNCRCGFGITYNDFGFLEGEDALFDNLKQWDDWQTKIINEKIDQSKDNDLIFEDTEFKLIKVLSGHESETEGYGNIRLFFNKLEVCGQEFDISEISGFALIGPQRVEFSVGKKCYELISDKIRCTRKYMQAIEYINSNRRR